MLQAECMFALANIFTWKWNNFCIMSTLKYNFHHLPSKKSSGLYSKSVQENLLKWWEKKYLRIVMLNWKIDTNRKLYVILKNL